MALSTVIALLQEQAAPDTSTIKIVSGVLAVVLVVIIVLRRKSGGKKKEEEDDF